MPGMEKAKREAFLLCSCVLYQYLSSTTKNHTLFKLQSLQTIGKHIFYVLHRESASCLRRNHSKLVVFGWRLCTRMPNPCWSHAIPYKITKSSWYGEHVIQYHLIHPRIPQISILNSTRTARKCQKAGERPAKTWWKLGGPYFGGILGDRQVRPQMAGQLQPLTISPSRSLSFAQNGVPTESSLSSFKAQHFEEFVVTLMPQMRQWMSHWCPTVPTSQFCPRTQFWPLGCHMLSYVIYIYIYIYYKKILYIYTHVLYLSYETFEYISCDANPNFTVNSRTFLCKRHNFRRFPNFWDEKLQVPWFMMRVWKGAIWLYSPL